MGERDSLAKPRVKTVSFLGDVNIRRLTEKIESLQTSFDALSKEHKLNAFRNWYNVVRLTIACLCSLIHAYLVVRFVKPYEAESTSDHMYNILILVNIDLTVIITPAIVLSFAVNRYLSTCATPCFPHISKKIEAYGWKAFAIDFLKSIHKETAAALGTSSSQYILYLTYTDSSESSWNVATQLALSFQIIVSYFVIRFLYAFVFDFLFWASHRIMHTQQFYWLHKLHHIKQFAHFKSNLDFDVFDLLFEGVICERIAICIVLSCFGMNFNVICWSFFSMNVLIFSFSVHIPFSEDLYSRFCDFLSSDKSFGISTPAQADHVCHHYFMKTNLGTFAIIDRLVGTYGCQHELKRIHDNRCRARLVRSGNTSYRRAIWSKYAHIYGDLGCDYLRASDFFHICLEFGLYIGHKQASKIAGTLDHDRNPGYISFGSFLDWWLENHPELSMNEKAIKKRLKIVEIFKKYDPKFRGVLVGEKVNEAWSELRMLLPMRKREHTRKSSIFGLWASESIPEEEEAFCARLTFNEMMRKFTTREEIPTN
jgi:sterol desaturase/sphingolipid hydroxylase (fatty acid hydroxylase superfamily)